MNTIQNQDLKTAIKDAINSNTLEGLPTQLLDKVAPVIDVNPDHNRKVTFCTSVTKTTSGAQTILTTPTNKRTFITRLIFSWVKNATCDIASGTANISMVAKGQTIYPIASALLTLTAERECVSSTFNVPLEIDDGTNIIMTAGTFTAGSYIRVCVVEGYHVERF